LKKAKEEKRNGSRMVIGVVSKRVVWTSIPHFVSPFTSRRTSAPMMEELRS
jgi:hypothetical protein